MIEVASVRFSGQSTSLLLPSQVLMLSAKKGCSLVQFWPDPDKGCRSRGQRRHGFTAFHCGWRGGSFETPNNLFQDHGVGRKDRFPMTEQFFMIQGSLHAQSH